MRSVPGGRWDRDGGGDLVDEDTVLSADQLQLGVRILNLARADKRGGCSECDRAALRDLVDHGTDGLDSPLGGGLPSWDIRSQNLGIDLPNQTLPMKAQALRNRTVEPRSMELAQFGCGVEERGGVGECKAAACMLEQDRVRERVFGAGHRYFSELGPTIVRWVGT
jgi:hypothetical protein